MIAVTYGILDSWSNLQYPISMKTPDFSHLPKPNIPWKGMARWTLAFWKALLKSPKNALGMWLSLFVTALDDTPYKVINADQSALIEKNSERLAIFVPGFQLWAWSLEALKSAFNEQWIPVLFPEKLPYGFDAVLCREHPEVLESYIAEYVEEIRQKYPDREIILLGHSYGGAKVAHVAKTFENDKKIIPIAMTPTLWKSGIISKAAHAIFFPHQSAVFGGEYDYLEKAEKYIHEHDLAFVMYDALHSNRKRNDLP